jgi:DNA-binding MarR family transcriptional regulator
MKRISEPSYETAQLVSSTCLCLGIQRAGRAIARHFDEAFRPLGLNNGQFSLLMTLNRPTPLTVGGLARELTMDRTTITRNLKPLERRGLLKIQPDEQDLRAKRIALTNTGRALLLKALPRWTAVNGAVAVKVRADLARFRQDLEMMANS